MYYKIMHVYARTYITIINVKCIIRKQHSTLKNKKFVAMQLKNLFHMHIVHMCSLSHVRLVMPSWTVIDQTPLSMEFSRQEYWSGFAVFYWLQFFHIKVVHIHIDHCIQGSKYGKTLSHC